MSNPAPQSSDQDPSSDLQPVTTKEKNAIVLEAQHVAQKTGIPIFRIDTNGMTEFYSTTGYVIPTSREGDEFIPDFKAKIGPETKSIYLHGFHPDIELTFPAQIPQARFEVGHTGNQVEAMRLHTTKYIHARTGDFKNPGFDAFVCYSPFDQISWQINLPHSAIITRAGETSMLHKSENIQTVVIRDGQRVQVLANPDKYRMQLEKDGYDLLLFPRKVQIPIDPKILLELSHYRTGEIPAEISDQVMALTSSLLALYRQIVRL